MKQINQFSILGMILAALLTYAPLAAQAGNVGWNVSVSGGYGGQRPAGPYVGPGWGLVGGEVGHITAFTVRILVTMRHPWFTLRHR
jgi:hypothetical protein